MSVNRFSSILERMLERTDQSISARNRVYDQVRDQLVNIAAQREKPMNEQEAQGLVDELDAAIEAIEARFSKATASRLDANAALSPQNAKNQPAGLAKKRLKQTGWSIDFGLVALLAIIAVSVSIAAIVLSASPD